jgi:DNA-directed RNA polymerase subunit H (RpoH/RPB5)
MTTQNSSNLITNIYNSRVNILNLMKNQGYNVEDYSNFSINEVNSMKQNNQLDMLLEMKTENPDTKRKNKIYIRYYFTKTLRQTNIQDMIDDLFNLEQILTKEDTLFIISKDDENDTLVADLKHFWEKDKIFIIVQSIKRLQFNILEHTLVPDHRVMPESEVLEIMRKYNIKDKTQFPEISRSDPVAKVICIRPGQVCHISRSSKTAVKSDYYRVCV